MVIIINYFILVKLSTVIYFCLEWLELLIKEEYDKIESYQFNKQRQPQSIILFI